MKQFGFLLILIFGVAISANAQKNPPVNWSFDIKKINESEYEVTAIAKMNPSWVIYSQFTDDAGPIPTFFMINGTEVKFEEKSKVIKEFDEMFDVDVMKFKESAVFTTIVKKNDKNSISGSVEYMTCDGARCLPPVEVAFDLQF
jgi:thiol:disulfide interchange protein DsbD